MAGGIDDIDCIFPVLPFPRSLGSSRGDGDTTFLLLGHPVHGRSTVVNLTDFVGHAGIIQNTLGGRGLAGVNMGRDSNIAGEA